MVIDEGIVICKIYFYRSDLRSPKDYFPLIGTKVKSSSKQSKFYLDKI
jgi:hypothetical protein